MGSGDIPLKALFLVGLIPNAAASWFNIKYNFASIVKSYPDLNDTFNLLQLIINGTFFPLCLVLFGAFAWPVVRGLPRAKRNELANADLIRLRKRCLRLGPVSVLICLWAWVVAGIVFPVAMHFSVHELPMSVHAHFIASQTLCGLLAVAYPQFGVSFLSLRCLYPAFVRHAALTKDDAAALAVLDRSQSGFLLVAACVPMLAVGLLTGIASENRLALILICIISMVGFGVVTRLTTLIRSDLSALHAIVAE